MFYKHIFPIILCLTLITSFQPVKVQSFHMNFFQEETIDGDSSNSKSSTEATAQLEISAPSAILMEASTGTIIYEKNSEEKLHPASITKIMTLILIFDALKSGRIHLDDTVSVSEYAASMGGSQVFLENGETQTVDTLIKCIAIASANDACVTMAEHIDGSEAEFVKHMNKRAKELGMNSTNFVNCCGLDADSHMTCARDVAIMSRELILKYPQIHDYSTVWMENITHETKKGSTEFGLTNTNKLIKQYQYATGLKTGSTSKAKYCVSATAKKDDVELIAVIMAAPDYKVRFKDATTLLNYGFGKCKLYKDENKDSLGEIKIQNGVKDKVGITYASEFSYLDSQESNLSSIKKEIKLNPVKAPIKKGDVAGEAIYSLKGKKIGSVNIIFTSSVKKASIKDYFKKSFHYWLL